MPTPIATIDRYMTKFPTTVSPKDTLEVASQKMRQHGIHHLPVMENDRLLGVVSDHDLEIVEPLESAGFKNVKVASVMTATPYVVRPLTSLHEVVQEMVARRYGSAIVAEGPNVIGIFTAVDALKAFADFLSGRIPAALE